MHCYCLHVNYIVQKQFKRSLHIGSLDPTLVQNFRSIPLVVLEILGFKLKNKNKTRQKGNVFTVKLCEQTDAISVVYSHTSPLTTISCSCVVIQCISNNMLMCNLLAMCIVLIVSGVSRARVVQCIATLQSSVFE